MSQEAYFVETSIETVYLEALGSWVYPAKLRPQGFIILNEMWLRNPIVYKSNGP